MLDLDDVLLQRKPSLSLFSLTSIRVYVQKILTDGAAGVCVKISLYGIVSGSRRRQMRIGVVACDIMKRELDREIERFPEVTRVIYLESALHVRPEAMKQAVMKQIEEIKADVDVVFLGYGFCQSLKGIDKEFDIPVVFPQVDDCISILLTPERRAEEIQKEAGTWFMTPGWAEAGEEMVFKELQIDRLKQLGIDPLEIAKELFTAYRRGLFIDTGVGDNDYFAGKAKKFCSYFDLSLEQTFAASAILRDTLERCRGMKAESGLETSHP
jgi:hypothetical protein